MLKNAKWIWAEKKHDVNEYADFIMDVSLSQVDENASFSISVDTEYALWINGQFVNCNQFHDYPQRKTYDTLAVGGYLREGKNRVALRAYHQGVYSFQYSRGERGVCFCLLNGGQAYPSSEHTLCRLSDAYQNGEVHKTTGQLGYGFLYDARREDDWQSPSYDASGWEKSREKEIKTELVKRPVKKLDILPPVPARVIAQGYFLRKDESGTVAQRMAKDFLSHREFGELFEGKESFPLAVREGNRGVYFVVDLGQEECGFLTFSLSASAGTAVDIGYGEHLRDMRVRTYVGYRNFANRYVCKEGRQSFTHYFKRIAGRYLQIHISGYEHLDIDYFGLLPVCYPFGDEARFYSSDALHNKIFETSVRTLKLCAHEHFEDCPWREQALYGLDSRNAMLYSYYAFGNYEFPRASLDLLGQSIRDDGFLQITAPTDETLTIPSFTLFWFVAMKEYADFSKDMDFIRSYWKQITHMIETYAENASGGLLLLPEGKDYWQFYEWTDGMNGRFHENYAVGDGAVFQDGVYNLVFYMALQNVLSLARLIGDLSFVERYTPILHGIEAAYNETFWDEEKGMFASYCVEGKRTHFSEFVQSLALYCGICGEERQKALCDALLCRKDMVPISLGVAVYKYEALIRFDRKLLRTVLDEIAEKWGRMLYQGATSFWETEKGEADFHSAGSLCHSWAAAPLLFYCKYVLGAFEEEPTGQNLFSYVKGYVPHAGTIESGRERA